MKVTYEKRNGSWLPANISIAYKVYVGARCIGQVFCFSGGTSWHTAPDRGASYRIRDGAVRSLISSQLGVKLWCPNCKSPVEFETWLDGSKELYDVCSKCNEPVEEITP